VSSFRISHLISACKEKKGVGFIDCKLDLSEPINFYGSLKGSKVKIFVLDGCGHSSKGDWANNPDHFENLISGLASEQDFKRNLGDFWMAGNNMKKAEVEELLDRYGFNGVRVLGCKE